VFEFQENDIRTKILIDNRVTKQIMTYTVNYRGFRIYVELFDKHLKHNNIKNKAENTQVLAVRALLYGCKNCMVQKKHEERLRVSRDKIFYISCGILII
jgi:hypothetical protein